MIESILIEVISNALENRNINIDSSVHNTKEWDSLGQLSILTALDAASDGRINNIAEIHNAKSVREILSCLTTHEVSLNLGRE